METKSDGEMSGKSLHQLLHRLHHTYVFPLGLLAFFGYIVDWSIDKSLKSLHRKCDRCDKCTYITLMRTPLRLLDSFL